jgi:hypothetical protein
MRLSGKLGAVPKIVIHLGPPILDWKIHNIGVMSQVS